MLSAAQSTNVFEGLGETALRFVVRYGYLAVVVFTFLEASLLFPLLPSEVVVPGAAAVLVDGPASFVLFVAAVTLGTTVGSLFAYRVFGREGRGALDRHGHRFGVSASEIDRADRWFDRWGESAVLWGRLLPVLRSVISIPAGFADMNRTKFTVYSAVGAAAFGAGVAVLVETGTELADLV